MSFWLHGIVMIPPNAGNAAKLLQKVPYLLLNMVRIVAQTWTQ
jgi:hypothetical protein